MRVLLCGGGTAGHVYPALAISEIIKRNNENTDFAYVVTKNGIENDLVNYKKYEIEAKGMKKRSVLANINTVLITYKGIRKCKKIIKEYKPDIVIGTGGYLGFPVLYAAHCLNIKTVIHESNAQPGKATLMLSRYMDLILLNYSESKVYFNKKLNIKVAGVPIRDGFCKKSVYNNKKEGITILCFGGSLGAEMINESALMLANEIIQKEDNVNLIWGCGKREYEKYRQRLEGIVGESKKVELRGYIDNMPSVLALADIVICRAGAMSISEVAYKGKCTVLIPSPNVANNHQLKNAKALANKNAAILVTEDKISNIVSVIRDLINDKEKREELSRNIKSFSNYDSNKIIYREIMKIM